MIEKKKIESEKVQEVMARSDEIPKSVLSARQFIITYFDRLYALQKSGRSLKAMHQFLVSNGIDVGTYESFRTVYRRAKRSQILPAAAVTVKAITSEKADSSKAGTDANAEKAPEPPSRPGWRPIRLANGTEVLIDPETGAKHFKI